MCRLFETGDLEEARLVGELRAIGCTVHDRDEHGNQFEVRDIGGHFSGHMDGCALGVLEAPKTWHVLEFKTHNAKSYAHLLSHGVKASKPQHYAQMMVYMGLTKMTRALYLAKNKDTDDLYGERVRYDPTEFKALMDRARMIISSNQAPERCAGRCDDFRCRMCDAQAICWDVGISSVTPALPVPYISCRQCCHATPEVDTEHGRWSCAKHRMTISRPKQLEACPDHLCLPTLISFADPTDATSDSIEFTDSADRSVVWVHGRARGQYSTKELMNLPAPRVGHKALDAIRDAFGGAVVGASPPATVGERYPWGECRMRWKGETGDIEAAWAGIYPDRIGELDPVAVSDGCENYEAEYDGGRAVIMHKATGAAVILEGVE
jgi:hypothetical protein